ncbi:hypothetical protein Golax_007559 [Gossypium laxum]|uniref:Ripening-related protein n=1 Tax=Gossypium laxum TaxID=34288 RepID=A0A7J9A783_9ROSI|nr:hypothetical protein [Gossypium laxum]
MVSTIPMWGLISAEEVALHLYEETASPHALFGGDGGDRSKCDEQSHDNFERIVALSIGWYDGGSRCGKMIRIMVSNGKSVTAKVVAIWSALELNKEKGIEDVTWSMA